MDVVDKVMQTYGMMVSLTPEQQREARECLVKFCPIKPTMRTASR
jgi:hypothetical protein